MTTTTRVLKIEQSFEAMCQTMLENHQEIANYCFGLLADFRVAIDQEEIEASEIQDEIDDLKALYDESFGELLDVLENRKLYVAKYTVLPEEFVKECSKYDIDNV